jgi:hypothetical protein
MSLSLWPSTAGARSEFTGLWMADNILPYQTPQPPRNKLSWLGLISVFLFVFPIFLDWILPNGFTKSYAPVLVTLSMAIVGFALGLTSVIRTHGASGWGWLGLILNSIYVIMLSILPFISLRK